MAYKIISLNTWGGQAFPALCRFVAEHADDTDVFCFQEVFDTHSDIKETNGARANLMAELTRLLPDHQCLPALSFDGCDYLGPVDFDIRYGLVTFIKKNLQLAKETDIQVHYETPTEDNYNGQPRNIHLVKIQKNDHQPVTVINFHGLWKKGFGKGDCPDRLRQSEKIKAAIEEHAEPVVLMGDFNLHPETQSLSILKENLRDLIVEYQIPGTRSNLYPKPERFADYALISPHYQIESFEVPQNFDASDHLPLILRIK